MKRHSELKRNNMWNPLKKPTNYPHQVLHPKQLALIEEIDQSLIAAHQDKPITGVMSIRLCGISFRTTLLPLSMIIDTINLEYGDSYIPRSVAFLVDATGNWLILYAIRTQTGSDDITTTMFMDLLTRTNNARTQ